MNGREYIGGLLAVWLMAAGVTELRGGEESAEERLGQLERQLVAYERIYYSEGRLEVSDAAYDALVRERDRLRRVQGMDVPAKPAAQWASSEYFHYAPMGGLEKAENPAALEAYIERSVEAGGEEVWWEVSPKVDGLAVNAVFRDGELEAVVTRGDGGSGELVTETFRGLVPMRESLGPERREELGFPVPELLELRGEVFCEPDTFEAINGERSGAGQEPYATPRSLAAGALLSEQVDPGLRGRLRCVFFDWGAVMPAGAVFADQEDFRDHLRGWGLPVFGEREVKRLESGARVAEALGQPGSLRREWIYPTDGVVIKVGPVAVRELMRERAAGPAWAIAVKWPDPGGWTRLREIVLEVGRTGRVTPRGIVEPVEVTGREIRRVSLYHPGHIQALDLREGDRVRVELAGDVIPEVVAVDRAVRGEGSVPWVPPRECPYCGGKLEPAASGGGQLFCRNGDCPERAVRRLIAYVEERDISGLGEGRIRQLWEAGLLRRAADLARLRVEQLEALDGFGSVLAGQLVAAIREALGREK